MSNLGFYGVSDATPFWVEPAGASGRLGRSRGGVGLGFRAIDGGDEMCEGADAKDFGPHARSACDAALRDPRGARAESPKVES